MLQRLILEAFGHAKLIACWPERASDWHIFSRPLVLYDISIAEIGGEHIGRADLNVCLPEHAIVECCRGGKHWAAYLSA